MNRTTLIWVGAGLAVVLLLIGLMGRDGGQVPQLDQEPMVNLADKETGEQKQLSMEEYIKGVVAGEMGQLSADGEGEDDWPHEAYAAQAILARTFALTFLGEDGKVDISTDFEEAQAYAPEKISPAIEKAVEETRGVVMAHDGRYAKAWFHSYSGGHTTTAKEGLNYQHGEPGFVVAKQVPENEYVPDRLKNWSTSIPLSEVSAALAEKGIDVGTIRSVGVAEWGNTGRATSISIEGSNGTKHIHAADFRVAVDSEELKSTKLDVLEVRGNELFASGTGFGHGVGLSQWDAYKMARDGKSAQQILEFFFKDVTIGSAWS